MLALRLDNERRATLPFDDDWYDMDMTDYISQFFDWLQISYYCFCIH